jgi:hypothetical protein
MTILSKKHRFKGYFWNMLFNSCQYSTNYIDFVYFNSLLTPDTKKDGTL